MLFMYSFRLQHKNKYIEQLQILERHFRLHTLLEKQNIKTSSKLRMFRLRRVSFSDYVTHTFQWNTSKYCLTNCVYHTCRYRYFLMHPKIERFTSCSQPNGFPIHSTPVRQIWKITSSSSSCSGQQETVTVYEIYGFSPDYI